MLVLRIFFSDQNEKENTEVKEKSIDKFYKKYNYCFRPDIEYLNFCCVLCCSCTPVEAVVSSKAR